MLWCMEETDRKLDFLNTHILPFQWCSPLQRREYQRFVAKEFPLISDDIIEQAPVILAEEPPEPRSEQHKEHIKQKMKEKLARAENLQCHLKLTLDAQSAQAFIVYAGIHSHFTHMAKDADLLDDPEVKIMLEQAARCEGQAMALKKAYSVFKLAEINIDELTKTFQDLNNLFDLIKNTSECSVEELLLNVLLSRTKEFLEKIAQLNLRDFESYLHDTRHQESELGKKLILMQESLQHMSDRLNHHMPNFSENVTFFSDEGARKFIEFLVHFSDEMEFCMIRNAHMLDKLKESFDLERCERSASYTKQVLTNLHFLESHRKFFYQDNKGKMPREAIQMIDKEIAEKYTAKIPIFEQSLSKLHTLIDDFKTNKGVNEVIKPSESTNTQIQEMSAGSSNPAENRHKLKNELQKVKSENENQEIAPKGPYFK